MWKLQIFFHANFPLYGILKIYLFKKQLNGSCVVNLYNVDNIEANTAQGEAIY